MPVAPGEGAQVGDDRGHAPGQFADQPEVVARVIDALVIEQHGGVLGVAADRRQRLVEFVADARAHGAEHRELAGLHQLVLGAGGFLLGMLAFEHLVLQPAVEGFQIVGAFQHAALQLLARPRVEGDAFQVMPAPLHQQAEHQHQQQQGAAADGYGGLHAALDHRARGEDVHRPAGFLQHPALRHPGRVLQRQRLGLAGRVGLVVGDLVALAHRQRTAGAVTPLRPRGEDHHAVMVGHQQLLGGVAPGHLGDVQVDLDHQRAERALAVLHRRGEVVAALAGGGAEAEEASLLTGDGLAEIRAKGEVAADEAVRLIPVRCGQGVAGGVHQVDHLGAGLLAQPGQQAIGCIVGLRAGRLVEHAAQRRQVAEDRRQHLVTAQRAEQVGDVEVQSLPILLGQLAAVIALGEVM